MFKKNTTNTTNLIKETIKKILLSTLSLLLMTGMVGCQKKETAEKKEVTNDIADVVEDETKDTVDEVTEQSDEQTQETQEDTKQQEKKQTKKQTKKNTQKDTTKKEEPKETTDNNTTDVTPPAPSQPDNSNENNTVPVDTLLEDRNNLLLVIKKAEGLNQSIYTETSYNKVYDILQKAKEIVKSNNRNDINSIKEQLEKAIQSLVTKTEAYKEEMKSELLKTIKRAESIDFILYTDDSAQKVLIEIMNGYNVYENNQSTADDYLEQINAIYDKINNLVIDENREARQVLKNTIDIAEEIDLFYYTQNSGIQLREAIDAANDLYNAERCPSKEVLLEANDRLIEAMGNMVLLGDITELEAVVEEARNLQEPEYTEESYAQLVAVINQCLLVMENPNRIQSEVDEALVRIQEAIDNLVSAVDIEKEKLNELITEAEQIDLSLYTQNSAQYLKDKMDYVKSELDFYKDDIWVYQLIGLQEQLREAIDQLIELGDATQLNQKIQEAKLINIQNYIEESQSKLNQAIEKASSVASDANRTQDMIDQQIIDLQNIIDNLELTSIGNLRDAITQAESINSTYYTDDSYSSLLVAINEGKAVLQSQSQDNEVYIEAVNNIKKYENQLVLKEEIQTAINNLNNKISEAKSILENKTYTDSTKQKCQSAIEDAQAIIDNKNYDIAIINQKISAIETSIQELVEVADKQVLEFVLNHARQLNPNQYTQETSTRFLNARNHAEEVLINSEATQEEVDATKDALYYAIRDLVPDVEEGTYNREYAKQVFDIVNAERIAQGIAPLVWDDALQNDVEIRAKELELLYSHTRPSGESCFTVISQDTKAGGENIARGYTSPEHVMNGWMNSSGHRANILNKTYTHMAVGCYIDANGYIHWVQLFIKK